VLLGLIRAYSQFNPPNHRHSIFKFASWNLLHILQFRTIWPDVPCLILIRDPVEVAVSCMKDPPGWLRKIHKKREKILSDQDSAAADEDSCGRMLGDFFDAALKQNDELCHVLDYKNLTPHRVMKIADWFKLPALPPERRPGFDKIFSTYSKDASQQRKFVHDTAQKQDCASPSLRERIDSLARKAYEGLLLRDADVEMASSI